MGILYQIFVKSQSPPSLFRLSIVTRSEQKKKLTILKGELFYFGKQRAK